MYGPPTAEPTSPLDYITMDTFKDTLGTGTDVDAHLAETDSLAGGVEHEPYHFHVYSHRHNTHITVTRPNRDPIVSMSCGNLGFRHAKRKTYDAAYQLTAYVLQRLEKADWEPRIQRMELILRGFGHGREAAAKVLVSSEGALWKKKIIRVSDATKIKFGGTRSPNARRL